MKGGVVPWSKTFLQDIFFQLRKIERIHQDSVVRRLISANPRINFNLDFFMHLFKCLFGMVSCVLYRASNNHILDKKNSTEFSFKAIRSEIRFHTNPGLSQPSFEQPGPGEETNPPPGPNAQV